MALRAPSSTMIVWAALCWCQAAAEAKAAGDLPRGAISALGLHPAGLPHHQLFFQTMKLRRPGPRARGRGQAPLNVRFGHLVIGLHGLAGRGVDGRDSHVFSP